MAKVYEIRGEEYGGVESDEMNWCVNFEGEGWDIKRENLVTNF